MPPARIDVAATCAPCIGSIQCLCGVHHVACQHVPAFERRDRDIYAVPPCDRCHFVVEFHTEDCDAALGNQRRSLPGPTASVDGR